MSRFWSRLTHELKPYVPGEQPRIAELVKLNTNESPFGPSPRALEAIKAEAADTLRLYPDPQASALRAALAKYHKVRPEQVFVGNGSDEVLAHTFAALLKHDVPLLFPDITYSFYPVYCRLFGISHEAVPLDPAMQIRIADRIADPQARQRTRLRHGLDHEKVVVGGDQRDCGLRAEIDIGFVDHDGHVAMLLQQRRDLGP